MAFQIKKLGKLFEMGGLAVPAGGVIGIDIGTSSLKVIQLAMGKSGPALETYGELQLGPYAHADIGMAVPLEPAQLATALVDIVREASVTARMAALAVPHSASFVVVAPFPTRDQAELQAMVPIEARKYVPMAMNEISLDWFMVPDTPSTDATKPLTHIDVLLAAIHNESLKRYRGVVQNAGIAVGVNEIEAFSVIRSSIHEDDSSVLLLDLGASATKTYIVELGILRETHRIPVGGQELTKELAAKAGGTLSDAELIKREHGLLTNEGAASADVLVPIIDRIIADAERSLSRYEREEGRKIEKVVLTGGGALLKGLPERVEKVLGRPTHVANPFSKVEYPAFLEATLREAGPSFAVAIGVGLRKLIE